ncbi:MAG: hypothetical protein ACE5G2_13695, partial [Candidatus Krumholzibacteriia bacterium]
MTRKRPADRRARDPRGGRGDLPLDRRRTPIARRALPLVVGAALGVGVCLPGASSAAVDGARAHVYVELAERPQPVSALHAVADAAALEAATGASWDLRWDPWTGAAARGVGGRRSSGARPGPAQLRSAAEAFRKRHARLLGADGVALQQVRWRHAGRAWHATWEQTHAGRRVVGALLDLTLREDGDVVAFRSTLVPDLRPEPAVLGVDAARATCEALLGRALRVESTEPVVVVLPATNGYEASQALHLVLSVRTGWRWRALVEAASGRVLALESLVRTDRLAGEATALVKPKYVQDRRVTRALPWLRVQLGQVGTEPSLSTHSDASGFFAFDLQPGEVTVHSGLTGLYVAVDNATDDPSPHLERRVTVPGQVVMHFTAVESRVDERTIYHHTNTIHDFVKQRFGFSLLDFPLPAIAESANPGNGDPNYPNAFWDGERMGFGNGGGTFWNLGLFADVIYHEYTHAVTDYVYRPAGGLTGVIGGAIHEALSDYFAATITGEPLLGENLFRRTPEPLRNLDNLLVWPDDRDASDEVHANGEILGGAFWDVRELAGPQIADAAIHFARELFPRTFEEYLDAMLVQDDLLFGDGFPGNGSPNRDAILTGFAMHGMGPLASRDLEILHPALGNTESPAAARIVRARLDSPFPGEQQFVRLSYRT